MEDDNPFADPSVSDTAGLTTSMGGSSSTEDLPSWMEEPAAPAAPVAPTQWTPPPAAPTQWTPAPTSEAAAWGGTGASPAGGAPSGWSPDEPARGASATSPGIAPPRTPAPAPVPAEPTKGYLVMTMRLLNMGISVLMSAAACIKLLSLPGFNTAIMALYIWFFAILLCCFETHLKQVSRVIGMNFGFLYHVKGRCAFFVLVSMLCFSLGLIGLLSGLGLLVAAGYNAYVIYKHPEYEQECLHADVEQLGPGSAADVYSSVYAPPGLARGPHQQGDWLEAGAGIAAQNPELAQQAGAAAFTWAKNNPDQAMAAANAAGGYSPPAGI